MTSNDNHQKKDFAMTTTETDLFNGLPSGTADEIKAGGIDAAFDDLVLRTPDIVANINAHVLGESDDIRTQLALVLDFVRMMTYSIRSLEDTVAKLSQD